jgi:hypothetical protein
MVILLAELLLDGLELLAQDVGALRPGHLAFDRGLELGLQAQPAPEEVRKWNGQ